LLKAVVEEMLMPS